MKKITTIIVMALLCLRKLQAERLKLKAKTSKLKAYSVIALLLCLFNGQLMAQELSPLHLGQKIPAAILNQKYPTLSTNTKQADSLSFSQFKGKLILLDFWAAWCTNCMYKFELLDRLQERYKAQFQVILVNAKNTKDTPERMNGILTGAKAPFIKSNLTSIYNDVVLNKLFPHRYLPHYVWIGTKGEVLALTGAEMVTENTVVQYIATIVKQNQKAQAELNKKP